MTSDDIRHLARLSRIALTDERVEALTHECDDILAYVDAIKELAKGTAAHPTVGAHRNVFREDANPHEGGIYTEKLLSAAPKREGRYLKVKKILNTDAT